MAVVNDGHDDAELLRRFDAAVAGLELPDLGELASQLALRRPDLLRSAPRPSLRRPRLAGVHVFTLRVDLDGARPPIWRRIEVRSNLTLDTVHQVLQAAFGWTDSHLHRFSLGGSPFAATSELFLCPFDVEEGEDDGVPAEDVRLDETIQEPGDVLHYVYDYGDSWELTIRLERVHPAEENVPAALCVAGRRAAPPEDCGHLTDAEELAQAVDDPAAFDIDEINQALLDPYVVLRDWGLTPRLVDLLKHLYATPVGDDLVARLMGLTTPMPTPTDDELATILAAFTWFLDRAADEGIELTSAGYLKPADVEAASKVLPAMRDWIGKNNRETHAVPLLDFRQTLQRLGLLRKYKGSLKLTRAGSAVRRSPRALWHHLAANLVAPSKDRFGQELSLLMLAYAASSRDGSLPVDSVAWALDRIGWRQRDGQPIKGFQLHHYEPGCLEVLANLAGPRSTRGSGWMLTAAASTLARAALFIQ